MENNDIKKYYFSEAVAKEVGVEEAIMFSNIFFWVSHNKKKKSDYHYYKGKYWMFNTVLGFKEQYPFWTVAMIRRILGNLQKGSYVEVGRFNKHGYDKTKWYTIAEKAFDVVENDKDFVETINSLSEEQPTNTR